MITKRVVLPRLQPCSRHEPKRGRNYVRGLFGWQGDALIAYALPAPGVNDVYLSVCALNDSRVRVLINGAVF